MLVEQTAFQQTEHRRIKPIRFGRKQSVYRKAPGRGAQCIHGPLPQLVIFDHLRGGRVEIGACFQTRARVQRVTDEVVHVVAGDYQLGIGQIALPVADARERQREYIVQNVIGRIAAAQRVFVGIRLRRGRVIKR